MRRVAAESTESSLQAVAEGAAFSIVRRVEKQVFCTSIYNQKSLYKYAQFHSYSLYVSLCKVTSEAPLIT